MNVLWTINVLHPILCMKQRSLIKQTMNVKIYRCFLTPFKERFRNHTRDFKYKKYEKCTELLKFIWTLKYHGITNR